MNKGYTIIEILIGIAIMIILIGAVGIPFKQLNNRQSLVKETAHIVSILGHARSQTLSSKGGVQHGVHLESTRVVLFRGSIYDQNDPNNVSISLHPLVNISNINLALGSSNVIFDRLTGTTPFFGTITISLVASSTQSKVITVNSTGIVDSNL